MRRFNLLILCLVLMGVHITAFAQDAEEILQSAEMTFVSGNYQETIDLYEGLLSEARIFDARVYANLGAAYARSGKIGQAAWAYAQALRLEPRNTEISADAALVLSAPDLSLWRQFQTGRLPIVNLLTRNEHVLLGACLYMVFWILVFIGFVTPSVRIRRLRIASLVFFAIWAVLSAPKLYREFGQDRAILVGDSASVTSSFVGGHELFTLKPGTNVRVIKVESFTAPVRAGLKPAPVETWIYIETDTGQRGWVANAVLRGL